VEVGGQADDLHAGVRVEQLRQSEPEQSLVVREHEPYAHLVLAGTRTQLSDGCRPLCRWRRIAGVGGVRIGHH
jgi:hypothetical protein